MKYTANPVLSFLSVVIISMMAVSCANIIPPGGGPRDSLPPRLVMAVPKDSTTNFNITTKRIVLTFNEYVTTQGAQENLIISPTLKNIPSVDSRLQNLTVMLRDTLEANTTYTLNFGNAIKDVNEGNIARDFSYVFSTGKTIDHYTYKGKVFLAETGKTDSTLIVVLHRDLSDSAIAKERPRYYTRISGKGDFVFHNLPGGSFAAYVLPNDYTKRYDDSTKFFAFLNTPVIVTENTRSDTLYVYQEAKKKEKTATTSQGSRPPAATKTKEDTRLKFIPSSLENGRQDLLSDLQLGFSRKFAHADSSRIVLCDTNYHPLTGYTVSADTSKTRINIRYNWKEDIPFRLLVAKDAVSDSAGITLVKADTIRFSTEKESSYGSIHLQFKNLDLEQNPVLQMVQSDRIIESFVLTSSDFKRRLYKPGTYELRILYDTNKNGVWDTGRFFNVKKQPEKVQFITIPFNVRGNWDNQTAVIL